MGDTQAATEDRYSQATRLLAIDTPLGPDEALLIRLEGEDVLSRCFVYRVTIATEQTDAAVQSLLGMPVTLWLANYSEDRRPIHGHVRRVQSGNTTKRGLRTYHLEVVPRLWFLTCTSDCRIFQNQSIPDILRTIFQEQGLVDFEFRIVGDDYPPVEYCVQYRETTFNFVSRLMEHLGLFYWHEHSAGRHVLVIADRNEAAGRCQPATVVVSPGSDTAELQSLGFDCSFRPGRWALNDYDFQSPTRLLNVNAPTTLDVPRMAAHEMYDFPGKFLDQDTGRWLTRRRIECEEAQQHRVFGTGRAPGFDPGRRFGVSLTHDGRETHYLLTEVRHHATDPAPEGDDGSPAYGVDFVAIPAETPFRPERLTPKPYVRGQQTATVVGPAGESIWCDQFGRVKVQFHWDRRGQRNANSSCWMRVMQSRAGSFYGHQVIPHVGHEAIVSFLEGDPDRPVITGAVPNALTMPPMELPLDKNKTIQRDHGDNKIVMQGLAGSERLSMISPRAVNLFASGRSARPVSAAATIPPPPKPGGNSLTFYADPSPNNVTSGGTFIPTTQSGSGDSVAVNVFKDGRGLQELWAEWYGTTQSDAANSAMTDSTTVIDGNTPATVATAGTYGTQDGTIKDSYLNWGSEGRINCLSLGNNNNWVNGDANTWVNGDVHAQFNGNSTTTYGSTDHGGNNTDVAVKTTIWGSNNSIILGANSTTVAGDNVTSVSGGNETFVGGLNLSVSVLGNIALTLGANLAVAFGGNLAVALGGNQSISLPQRLDFAGADLRAASNRVEAVQTWVHDASVQIKSAGFYLSQEDARVEQAGAALLDVDLYAVT